MANTLEVVKFRDVITITDIPRYVPDQEYPTLEILGEDFSSVEEVYLNEVRFTTYIVVNRNVLWLVLPLNLGELRTVEVVSGNFTKTAASSKLEFKIGMRPRRIEGILKLVQLYTKWMLQSPGSDIFQPRRGGGLQDIAGSLISLDRMDPILSALTRAIQTTTAQIRESQVKMQGLSMDERLLDAVLLDVDRSEQRLEVRVRVHVISMAGDEAISALVL